MTVAIEEWDRQLVELLTSRPELQTWTRHLELRLPEIRYLAGLMAEENVRDLLEIGCGNGLGSAYFSRLVPHVVASDLPSADFKSHAIGLTKPRRLLEAIEARNVELVGCSAQEMPFDDASFDAVLAMHTLEHLPDVGQGLAECLRVLRPGGRLIASVPAAAWSAFSPVEFYTRLAERVFRRFVLSRLAGAGKGGAPSHEKDSSDEASAPVVRDWASFRRAYPQFPLPSPHGEYPSWFHELWELRPERWREVVARAGFSRVEVRALSVVPRSLLGVFFRGREPAVYAKLRELDRRARDNEAVLPLAQAVGIVAWK